MIRNEKQYKITKAHLNEFEAALAERKATPTPEDVDEGMWQLEQEALQSQVDEFKVELAAFDKLKSGEVQAATLTSLSDLATLLIQARIAQGLTQKDLAERLNVKEQQVQKDEANLYESASLSRLTEVLGLEFEGQVRLPVQH